MELVSVMKTLSELCAPSGREEATAAELARLAEPLADQVQVDPLYNVIAWKRSPRPDAPTLLLDAHHDEVCLMVREVDDRGFLRIVSPVGMDPSALLAANVTVHGKRELFGVVSCMPPHLLTAEAKEKNPKISELAVDVGLSAERAREFVSVGDFITWQSDFTPLAGTAVSGKALDDRACAAILLKCLEELREDELPFHLAVLFSVQEEAGLRGAKVGAYRVDPAEAVVLDVSHAVSPGSDAWKCGRLGGGPMIGVAPILSGSVTGRLKETAKRHNIPFQVEVMAGSTGTNSQAVQISRSGVRTGLLSVPLRFMHTPIERIDLRDAQYTADLLTAYLRERGAESWNLEVFA